LPRGLVQHLGSGAAHRGLRAPRRAGTGAEHGAGDVLLLGTAPPRAGAAPGAQRPHGRDGTGLPAPLRRHRHRAAAVAAPGRAGAGALHGAAAPAGRADRQPRHPRGRPALEPRRPRAVRVLPGRRRAGRGDPGAPVGHDGHRHHAQVLAAMAGGHARRAVAGGVLAGVRRRAGAAAGAQGLPCPWRRQLPLHDRAHRARLQHAPRPGRDRQPAQPARVPQAPVLRLLGRRRRRPALPARHLRRGPGDARHGLPVPPGRTGAGCRHRRARPRRGRPGTPLPRHRAGLAGPSAVAFRVSPMHDAFDESHARALDERDPLPTLRDEFHVPRFGDGEQAYFVGNSLGLQPRNVRGHVLEVLDTWAEVAVEGHFRGHAAWMPYHELVRDGLARVVGARPGEVVAMNSLTTNLHLMMVSFYRPTAERPAILVEAGAFPTDRYAVESQIRFHGFDPSTDLVEVQPDEPGGTVSMGAIERAITEYGPRLALVLWPGVQYRTGQAFDLAEIARLAHAQGACCGFDLAHSAGNI